MSLACVENDEKECEDKISKYENDHLVDLYTAPIDQRRSEIYDKVETIYCHLKNSFESIETLERESSNTNHKPDDVSMAEFQFCWVICFFFSYTVQGL